MTHAEVLSTELQWFQAVLNTRVVSHFRAGESEYAAIEEVPLPDHTGHSSSYARFLESFGVKVEERIILILALIPHLKPDLLDVFFSQHGTFTKRFSEVGGRIGNTHTGMLPTVQMALFLLAGDDLQRRLYYWPWFEEDGRLIQAHVLRCPVYDKEEPPENRGLQITPEYLAYFMAGTTYRPVFSSEFPAKQITTLMQWEDVVLDATTKQQIMEIQDWLMYGDLIMEELGLKKRIKPGYTCLFFGPPGTGKTLTASLLGKSTGKEVYKIDLAMVQSKYIGETEKNLSRVFDQAEKYRWILFFDEADSLFGARTEVTSANDRFANNSVGYLLQRIEDFSGVVILATNLRDNIDKAFTRRFQSMVRFQLPGVSAREAILVNAFSEDMPLESSDQLKSIAEKYEFSGGMAMNVVRACTLWALKNKKKAIPLCQLDAAFKNELKKEGILLR